MDSRERVKASLEFTGPDRIPFNMFVSGESDVHHARGGYGSDPREDRSDPLHIVDHFGCAFARSSPLTMGQPTDHPMPDIRRLDAYRFPDPCSEARLAPIGGSLARAGDRYVTTSVIWYTFFERMHFIHGFRETLEDLYLNRDYMEEFADRVTDYNVAVVNEVARRWGDRIDGFRMSDDWGGQQTTLVSGEMFRSFFMPRYERLFGTIKDHGMHVWLHSCGNIIDFMPLFIEVGVDAVNLQQPRIFDIEEMGRRFAGKICFNVPVDIQNTMPHGPLEDIRAEAQLLVDNLATDAGGIVANEHPDYAGNGIDPIKGKWAYDAFLAADRFSKRAER